MKPAVDYSRAVAEAVSPAAFHAPARPEEWPEPQSLPEGLPLVAAFEPDLLPSSLRAWVEDVSERMQCPRDYPAAAALVGLAAVVGRRVGICPKRADDWLVIPNLWGAVIGRPGLLKTPALIEPLRPIHELELDAKRAFEDQLKEWEADQLVNKEAAKLNADKIKRALKSGEDASALARQSIQGAWAEKPERQRYITNDPTVEKLGEILAANPRGVLVFRDELTGFLRSMEREGRESDRSFYLESWSGTGRFTYDRIGRGTIDIESCCVSILSGIQPGPLASYLEGAVRGGTSDDGLIQRFQMMVYPDPPREWRNIDRCPNGAARQAAKEVYHRLAAVDPAMVGADGSGAIPFLRFEDDAQKAFDEWRGGLECRLRSGDLPPALEAHLAKYRSLVPSLALLCHLADGGQGRVTIEAMLRAAAWAEYLESHARRVYDAVIRSDLSAARALGNKILRKDLVGPFSLKDVYRPGWGGLSERTTAAAAVEILCDLAWLQATDEPTPGRTRTRYHVNPRVWEPPQ
jgi:hypothetical protein